MTPVLNSYTQQGLNALVNAGLPITGNYLDMTTAAAEKLKKALRQVCGAKMYNWDPYGMFIAIRMDDVLTNRFTDWGVVLLENGMLYCFPMSTKPGLLCMQRADTLGGVVAEGQYDSHTLQGPWWSGASFALQTGPIMFYRDVDRDGVITRGKVYQASDTGFNIHTYRNDKTGWLWNLVTVSDPAAGVLSRGCQVMQYSVHSIVWPLVQAIGAKRNGRLRYTLLHFSDIAAVL